MPHEIDEELALKMYETMVKLQTMDVIFYEAQRQVRAGVCICSMSLHIVALAPPAAIISIPQSSAWEHLLGL